MSDHQLFFLSDSYPKRQLLIICFCGLLSILHVTTAKQLHHSQTRVQRSFGHNLHLLLSYSTDLWPSSYSSTHDRSTVHSLYSRDWKNFGNQERTDYKRKRRELRFCGRFSFIFFFLFITCHYR